MSKDRGTVNRSSEAGRPQGPAQEGTLGLPGVAAGRTGLDLGRPLQVAPLHPRP
jgi:hypothetical protein